MLEPLPGAPTHEPGRGAEASGRRGAGGLRRLYMTLRTEHTTPGKLAAATAVGVFVGCSPFWGLHLAIALLLATLFELNRVLVYAATNLVNPLTAPPLIFAEVQVGHRILTGAWLGLAAEEIGAAGIGGLFVDFLVGSLVVGGALSIAFGALAYGVGRAGQLPRSYQELVDGVVLRYLDISIRDAEGARFRLTRDPIFPFLLNDPALAVESRILDLGCGRGVAAALAACAPELRGVPRSYLGVDVSERYIRVAREALGDLPGYVFLTADLRDFDPPPADLVLLLRVLRFLPPAAQDALLRRLGKALPPGARLLVREADADAGWRFRRVQITDFLSRFVPGRPHHRPGYRRAADLRNALVAAGFDVRDRTTLHSTSRSHVLFEARRRPTALPGSR